jgi:hypothetical protein
MQGNTKKKIQFWGTLKRFFSHLPSEVYESDVDGLTLAFDVGRLMVL